MYGNIGNINNKVTFKRRSKALFLSTIVTLVITNRQKSNSYFA